MNRVELENNIVDFISKQGYQVLDFNAYKKGETLNISFSIFSKNGVTVKDCSKVTISTRDFISMFLEEDFFIDVSSPGAERELKSFNEFGIFSGKKAKIILKNGDILTGILDGIEKDSNNILFVRAEKNDKHIIPFNDVNKCKLLL